MAPDTAFYDQRAASYAAASHDMDLRPLYARFLPHVRPGGRILDAGCGSGRDALAFRQAGFRVEAFDASPQMARQAALLLGQDVPVLCFEEVVWQERFDGIWACASLLHVRPGGSARRLAAFAACPASRRRDVLQFQVRSGAAPQPGRAPLHRYGRGRCPGPAGDAAGTCLPGHADRGGRPRSGAAGALDTGPCPAHPAL